jgi:hypothetical protein
MSDPAILTNRQRRAAKRMEMARNSARARFEVFCTKYVFRHGLKMDDVPCISLDDIAMSGVKARQLGRDALIFSPGCGHGHLIIRWKHPKIFDILEV